MLYEVITPGCCPYVPEYPVLGNAPGETAEGAVQFGQLSRPGIRLVTLHQYIGQTDIKRLLRLYPAPREQQPGRVLGTDNTRQNSGYTETGMEAQA